MWRESLLRKHWNLQKRNFIGLEWTQFLGSILQKLKSFSFHRKFNVAQIVSLRRAASFYFGEKKIRPTKMKQSLLGLSTFSASPEMFTTFIYV